MNRPSALWMLVFLSFSVLDMACHNARTAHYLAFPLLNGRTSRNTAILAVFVLSPPPAVSRLSVDPACRLVLLLVSFPSSVWMLLSLPWF